MTRRGAAVLIAPLLLVAAGASVPSLAALGIALFAAALAVVAIDQRRAVDSRRLSVRREHAEILSVGVPNAVRLHVDVQGSTAQALVRDEHPPRIAASAGPVRVRLPATIEYTLTPHARGESSFGRTVVRVEGPWRLAERQCATGAPDRVRVDPDVSAVSAYEALARRGHLAELGVRALRSAGEGTEFERIREAMPDDPLRFVNWAATARTGRLMATQLIPERSQPVVICLDHGRLMGVGAGALTKLDHAVNAALLLVNVALRSGDRAGLLSFSDRVTAALAPRAGRVQLRAFLDAARPLEPGDTEADYDAAFTFLSAWQRRRALLAIFTDFLDADQGAALVRQCARLKGRHLPMVITVRDPAVDAAARERPSDAAAAMRRSVAAGLLADRDDVLRTLRRSGVDTIDADVRQLTPRVINRYLELKSRARL